MRLFKLSGSHYKESSVSIQSNFLFQTHQVLELESNII